MLITIKEVRQTSGQGKGRIISTVEGQTLSCFIPALFPMFVIGATLDVVTEVKGQYTHILTAKPATPTTPAPIPATASTMPVQPQQAVKPSVTPPVNQASREASIEAQVAVKAVSEMVSNGKLDVNGQAGQYAVSWCIIKLREALPEAIVSMIDQRIKAGNEPKEAKPKKEVK